VDLHDRRADYSSQARIESVNPSTEEVVGSFSDANDADVDRVVKAAVDGAREWRSTTWAQRSACLRQMARKVSEAEETLARLDAIDSGNPITAMRQDVRNAVNHIEYFAGLAPEAKGYVLPTPDSRLVYTRREPYGVAARIIPFNHPAQFAAAKIAAPLAAGNSVVLKPAEVTSLSALHLRDLVADIFPAGVLTVLTGRGDTAGDALVRHPDVPRVAFTGSVPTGQQIMRQGAAHLKVLSLELGGKNPMIVFPDVDVEAAAGAAVDGMNFKRSQGQSCGSNSRVFVHDSIYDDFLDTIVPKLEAIVVGDACDEATEMGPIAFKQHFDRVNGYVERGVAEGARLVTGGGRPPGLDRGYFLQPTLFDQVDGGMAIAREEIFGPVLSLFKWSNVDDVLAQANSTTFGLTATVWTNDLSAAHRLVANLNAGYVWVNGRGNRPVGASFGGFGQSGLGKENSLEELLSYTREKTVDVSLFG
jgi:betaine-aldehyde dehydrogenase